MICEGTVRIRYSRWNALCECLTGLVHPVVVVVLTKQDEMQHSGQVHSAKRPWNVREGGSDSSHVIYIEFSGSSEFSKFRLEYGILCLGYLKLVIKRGSSPLPFHNITPILHHARFSDFLKIRALFFYYETFL